VEKALQIEMTDITFSVSDVAPYEDDLIVLSVVLVRRNVHRVLIDQGSSTDVFRDTFVGLQIPKERLHGYNGVLVGFSGEHVEVRGYVELRTTFFDGTLARTIMVKYVLVNTSSSYNLLVGRPSLN